MSDPFHQETTEVKRKSVKRAFKSEKEFLEFTLKYQQVLTERDSGSLLLFLPSDMYYIFSSDHSLVNVSVSHIAGFMSNL